MSGRGLGFTGGTIDKLEAIPGYDTSIDIDTFKQNVKSIGISLIGQTLNLAPADKKIYALRDTISCVENMSLIASSIMSKKIAAGANKIVLDVTCGSGAFMKNEQDAIKLSEIMKKIGELANKETVCVITNMDEPLGKNVGNTLEILEVINALKGNIEKDVQEVVLELGAYMVKLAGKGENIETEINVNIEEAFYGAEKKISLRTVEGKMKTFAVAIPAGIRNSEKVRLLGQGKEGSNGGKNGDLFIKINIQDGKKYKLKGLDIYTDLKITPWEAALGTRISVDSIDETLSLCIPQGTESGEKVRIPNKGYKDGKGGRGDLIAEVKIMIPKKMSEEEKQLFEQFNKISKYNPREA